MCGNQRAGWGWAPASSSTFFSDSRFAFFFIFVWETVSLSALSVSAVSLSAQTTDAPTEHLAQSESHNGATRPESGAGLTNNSATVTVR